MSNPRIPLLVRQWMYNLRGGFLVRPLIIAVALGAAGATLSWLEELFPLVSAWVPTAIFPSHADPQVAQVILGAIGASIMTVVSIVFAILLMTLTLASMQFSPRIILGFATDGVTQWTLGIFLGTFCYCMAALPAARSLPHPFSPVATVLGAMLLALACVAWLLFFIHHISHAISVNHLVDRIASETERIVDEMMPWPRKPNHFAVDERIDALVWESTLLSETSGYIRFIDTARVLGLAKQYRIKIRITRRVGHFVPAGVPLALVSRAERASAELIDQLRQAIDIGPSRTLQQDIEFGILQIVDIALKAISPAVNDPSTAISCVDQLSRILIRVASREAPESGLYDPPGNLRVWIPWIGFEGLFQTAFEQIRWYGRADVAVSLRLLRALGDIASTVDDQAMRMKIADRARCVVAGCDEQLGEEALMEMRARLALMERSRENLN
ncbi:MAG TPA: DUF2254 domain-containing protein [Bryobacteraceae bacterium]|nr:DUF2254 domain-containing protein [Bryobacteraceae bacterium]